MIGVLIYPHALNLGFIYVYQHPLLYIQKVTLLHALYVLIYHQSCDIAASTSESSGREQEIFVSENSCQ